MATWPVAVPKSCTSVEVAINLGSNLTRESLDSLVDGRNLGITKLLKIEVKEEAFRVKVFPQEWFTNQA